MTTRNFCFGIVRVQINVGKYAAVGVPTADVGTFGANRELLAGRLAAFDRECRVLSSHCDGPRALLRNQAGNRRICRARDGHGNFLVAATLVAVGLRICTIAGTSGEPKRSPAFIAVSRPSQVLCTA